MDTLNSKQLNLDQLLCTKQTEADSNADIIGILNKAENTLSKLDEYFKNKEEQNREKSLVIDIMVCYWNAVGIKLQFVNDNENINTNIILINHDQENEELQTCKVQMKITDDKFDSKFQLNLSYFIIFFINLAIYKLLIVLMLDTFSFL